MTTQTAINHIASHTHERHQNDVVLFNHFKYITMNNDSCFFLCTFITDAIDDVHLIHVRKFLTKARADEQLVNAQQTFKNVYPSLDCFFRVTNSNTGNMLIEQNPNCQVVNDWQISLNTKMP